MARETGKARLLHTEKNQTRFLLEKSRQDVTGVVMQGTEHADDIEEGEEVTVEGEWGEKFFRAETFEK